MDAASFNEMSAGISCPEPSAHPSADPSRVPKDIFFVNYEALRHVET
jgi:hypothetical protein